MANLASLNPAPVYPFKTKALGEIKFRPFTSAEQKALLIAKEDEDEDAIFNTSKAMLESATFNKVDINKLYTFDMEGLLIKIRSKSVGDELKYALTCSGKDCGHVTPVTISLSDVSLSQAPQSNTLQLGDTLFVVMDYPRVESLAGLKPDDNEGLMARCIKTICKDDEVYPTSESTEEEVREFVKTFSDSQYDIVFDYLQACPTLSYSGVHKCSKCGKEHKSELKGFNSFFR